MHSPDEPRVRSVEKFTGTKTIRRNKKTAVPRPLFIQTGNFFLIPYWKSHLYESIIPKSSF
jgi:hypothetical protein